MVQKVSPFWQLSFDRVSSRYQHTLQRKKERKKERKSGIAREKQTKDGRTGTKKDNGKGKKKRTQERMNKNKERKKARKKERKRKERVWLYFSELFLPQPSSFSILLLSISPIIV